MISSHSIRNITGVIDIGLYRTHIGLVGEASPQISTYSNLVQYKSLNEYSCAVGDEEILEDRTDIQLASIFTNHAGPYQGNNFNYERYIEFIEGALADKLKLGRELVSLVITEDIYESQNNDLMKQREKICELMFEELNIVALSFMKKPALSTMSLGKHNCIVVDSGHTGTRVSIVQDGYVVYSKIAGYGGNTINQLLSQKVGDIKLPKQNSAEPYQPSYIEFQKKHFLSSIKHSFKTEIINFFKEGDKMVEEFPDKVQYQLPDGNMITLQRQEIYDPFVNYPKYFSKYLNPNAEDKEFTYAQHIDFKNFQQYRSLSNLILSTLKSFLAQNYPVTDPNHQSVKTEYLRNIMLTGGNILFADLVTKLTDQLKQKEPVAKVNISPIYADGKANHNSTPFVGASIAADLPIFSNFWISQNEWMEAGNKIGGDQNHKIQSQANLMINLSHQPTKTTDPNTLKAARNNIISKKFP